MRYALLVEPIKDSMAVRLEIITTPVKFVALVFFEEFNWAGGDTRKITENKIIRNGFFLILFRTQINTDKHR